MTYNRVNRLVGRVLLDASVLSEDGDERPGFAGELREAEQILIEDIGSTRRGDPWAYCDLGTIKLLAGAPDVPAFLSRLDRLRPPPFVYDSWLATLQSLDEAASQYRPELAHAIAQVRRSAANRPRGAP